MGDKTCWEARRGRPALLVRYECAGFLPRGGAEGAACSSRLRIVGVCFPAVPVRGSKAAAVLRRVVVVLLWVLPAIVDSWLSPRPSAMCAFVPTFAPTGFAYGYAEHPYMGPQGAAPWRALEEKNRILESSHKWAAWAWGDETEGLAGKPLSAKALCKLEKAMSFETASTAASTDSDTATTCSDDAVRTPMKLKELPCLVEDYEVEKTFITVRPAGGARKRES